jgi:hypothetical protein
MPQVIPGPSREEAALSHPPPARPLAVRMSARASNVASSPLMPREVHPYSEVLVTPMPPHDIK